MSTSERKQSGFSVNNLRLNYKNHHVLKGLSFDLAGPCMVGLIGPNAAGKSSLLKSIAGLAVSTGDIFLHQQNLNHLSPAKRLRRIAYMPQTLPQVSYMLAYETLYASCRIMYPSWGRNEIAQAIEQVLESLGLQSLALRKIAELSVGQRQMFALAQILIRRASMMLLDEPTSALDPYWQIKLINAVRQRVDTDASVCIMALHDINMALRYCDLVLVLADGLIHALGPGADVITPKLLANIYGIKARVETCSAGFAFVINDALAD